MVGGEGRFPRPSDDRDGAGRPHHGSKGPDGPNGPRLASHVLRALVTSTGTSSAIPGFGRGEDARRTTIKWSEPDVAQPNQLRPVARTSLRPLPTLGPETFPGRSPPRGRP